MIYLTFCSSVRSLCADDTVLYLTSKNEWLRANQLTLNVKKSKFLPIGSSSCLSKIGSILISADDIPLDNVDSCTYLGIVINNRFSWTDYIDYICGKISKKLGLWRRIKPCLPLNTKIMFFNDFILPLFDYEDIILPLFDYEDIIWGNRGYASLMSELQVLENKAACLILDLPAHFSAAGVLKILGWKSLLRRRKEHHAIFMYKLINNHFHHSIPLTFTGDSHSYSTRSRNDIRKSSAARRWGHRLSVNFSSNTWNGLDTSLRNVEPLPAYKRGLSKVIFDS